MLSKEEVQKMADLFFGGEPEEAYKMVSSMAEWEQFVNSVTTNSRISRLAYDIMCRSDLSVWRKHVPHPLGRGELTYRGEIKLPDHVVRADETKS